MMLVFQISLKRSTQPCHCCELFLTEKYSEQYHYQIKKMAHISAKPEIHNVSKNKSCKQPLSQRRYQIIEILQQITIKLKTNSDPLNAAFNVWNLNFRV